MSTNRDKPLCIIPASGASQRLSKKNIRKLNGKPLVMYAVEAAKESQVFDEVCVSTEDDEVIETLRNYGIEVPFKRPEELNSTDSTVVQVCLHALSYYEEQGMKYKSFGVLLPTSPLRTANDVKEAYKIFVEQDVNYVMSVTPYRHPPLRAVQIKDREVEPYFGEESLGKAQELPDLYRHDGAVVFGKTDVFREKETFYGDKVAPYYMPPEKAVDIDNKIDLKEAEFLMDYLKEDN